MLKFYYRSGSRNQAVPTSESGVDLTVPLDSVLAEESRKIFALQKEYSQGEATALTSIGVTKIWNAELD